MPRDIASEPEGAPGLGSRIARTARHPVALLLVALTLFAGGGALLDSLTGPEGEATHGCVRESTDWRPLLRESMLADRGSRRLLDEWRSRKAYDRVWRRVAPLLGAAGTAPPRMRFIGDHEVKPNRRAAMWVGPDEVGCRTIFIAPSQRRALGKTEGNLRSRDAALTRTLHETAHYFQSDPMLRDVSGRELGASRWAKAHGPGILRTRRAGTRVAFSQWRDRDQFGDNYGADPQTFGWPGSSLSVEASKRARSQSRVSSGPPPVE